MTSGKLRQRLGRQIGQSIGGRQRLRTSSSVAERRTFQATAGGHMREKKGIPARIADDKVFLAIERADRRQPDAIRRSSPHTNQARWRSRSELPA